jgi:hypothetical protein
MGKVKSLEIVKHLKAFNAGVDMVIKGAPDILGFSGRVHTGKIESQDKIGISQLGEIPADLQIPEKLLELILFGHIVIVLQHGQEKALAEPAGADEKLKIVLFQGRDTSSPVAIKVSFPANFSEITNPVWKFHWITKAIACKVCTKHTFPFNGEY